MKSLISRGIILVLPLLLLGAIFYPAAPTTPYQSDIPKFAITHESTQEFNDTVTDRNAAMESAVPVEELSKSQRKAFETAKEQEPDSYGRLFKPPVCENFLLICDGYTEYPEAPDNGNRYLRDTAYCIPSPYFAHVLGLHSVRRVSRC